MTPQILFITGDHEYLSASTMPRMAELLRAKHGMQPTVLYATRPDGKRDPEYDFSIPGLAQLAEADLAVFYLRFRQLPPEQLEHIRRYVKSGRPAIGFRTATHSFRYPAEDPRAAEWNDRFAIDLFGQKWIRHHGHDSSTRARPVGAEAKHLILRGIPGEFWSRSWLYVVAPLNGQCRPLLEGESLAGEGPGAAPKGVPREPLAWVKTDGNRRVFFTTLGHPDDFVHPHLPRLFVNAVYWALGREAEIPPGGSDAAAPGMGAATK